MRKLRVALVGCGSIGKNYHLRAYQSLTDIAEVVAICDINPERLKAASEEYNITHAYASIEELLANEKDLDYVDVCTWPSAHAPVAVAAAKAGLHVLCEKPLAATVEQGLEIEKAVKDAGVNFMLAVVTRYGGEQAKFVEMRDAGVFGDIYYAKVAYIRRRGTPGGWFTNKEFAGGGPVLDIGVHAIDRTWYLMGRPKPVTVSAETSYRIGDTAKAAPAKGGDNGLFGGWSAAGEPGGGINDVEDSAAAFIRFEDGKALFAECSWTLNGEEHEDTYLYGTKAGASFQPLTVYGQKEDGTLTDEPIEVADVNIDRGTFAAEIRHFIECINENKTPISGIDDAVTVQKMLAAIYRSAEKHREVPFEE